MTSSRDSGQIGVLVIAVAAVMLVVVQGLVRFGDALVDSARAQSGADAVALAVAAGRADVIDDVIRELDATIVEMVGEHEVMVRVSVDGREARSRAMASGAATTP